MIGPFPVPANCFLCGAPLTFLGTEESPSTFFAIIVTA